jgi:hypothetical protein
MVVVLTGSGAFVESCALVSKRHTNPIAENKNFLNIAVDFKVK